VNLSQLTSQFLALMNRSDLNNNPALATTFLNQSILRLQRELRVPFMEKIVRYTIPSTYDPSLGLVIPSDLIELIDINIDSDGDGLLDYPLQRVQLKDAMRQSQVTDRPRVFARRGGYWVIGPTPAVGAVVEIVYYCEFAPLVNPTDTNTISNIAWDAVVYGALSAACDYYNDERNELFEARYKQIGGDLQAMADGDELSADAAVRPALLMGNDYSQSDGMGW
jgi:hypothetical protein